MIYCDAASAMASSEEVLAFYHESLQNDFCNQEARHAGALAAREKLHAAEKELLLALLGRDDFAVIWGHSATELFNVFGAFVSGKKIALSRLEHPALDGCCRRSPHEYLANSCEGALLPGGEDAEVLVVHQVQSELGVMQELSPLFAATPNALHFVDAVQAAGKLPLVPGADVYAVSGVKFGAPGGAALLVRRDGPAAKLPEFAERLRHEEYRMGRIPVPLALTLSFTARRCAENLTRNLKCQRVFAAHLQKHLEALGLKSTIPAEHASPYILHFLLAKEEAGVVVRMLSAEGLYAASGSACSSESRTGSDALRVLGCSRAESFRGLRLSFGFGAQTEEADFLAETIARVLKNY